MQSDGTKRCEFIATLGGAATAWPLTALPTIDKNGVLNAALVSQLRRGYGGILAGVAAWWIYWLIDLRDHVITEARERAFKPKDILKECTGCPEMIVVPAGEFMMGWPETENGYSDNEGPQHKVTIARPFAVARFELTFAEWDACAADGDCARDIRAAGWERGRQPAVNVSWNDAQDYVAWLSRMTGKSYQLLFEAEWEYAARAGTTTRYSFGDDEADLGQYAWYSANSDKQAHPVGEKTPNAFGVFDMHGNVWEWVEDCYHDDYEGAPVDGAAWATGGCGIRVVRGASWGSNPQSLRATNRLRNPTVNSFNYLGFRVGRTLLTP